VALAIQKLGSIAIGKTEEGRNKKQPNLKGSTILKPELFMIASAVASLSCQVV